MKKKLSYPLMALAGVLINFLNLILGALFGSIQLFQFIETAILDVLFGIVICMEVVPLGTIAVTLLGGSIPGMITALITGIVYIIFEGEGGFVFLAFGVIYAALCLVIRNKGLLKSKRNVLAAGLVLLLLSVPNVYNSVGTYDGESPVLYAIIIMLMVFLLILAELFIIRSLMPRFERSFPVNTSVKVKNYRNHSIKRDILLLVNITAACLSVVFVVYSIQQYDSTKKYNAYEYANYADYFVRSECLDDIMAISSREDFDCFDDSSMSKAIASLPVYDYYVSEIQFSVLGNEEMVQYIGSIIYEYSCDEYGYLKMTSGNKKEHDDIKNVEIGGDKSFVFIYENEEKLLCLTYIVEPSNENSFEMLGMLLSLIFISLAIIIMINVFMIRLMDKHIVDPLNGIATAASAFAYDTDEHRAEAMENFKALAITSGDEVENLYTAITKTMSDMNDNISHIKEQAKRISDMQHNIILTMADIVESRDENTGGHIRRTAEYVKIIAEKLRENGQYSDILTDEYIEDMIVAAPLHDMGKIHVSDSILNKPGKLDKDEYAIMQTHTTAGRELLENATHTLGAFSYLDMAVQMAAYHHEKWNGKGYPEGLSGTDIPLCARIMAVADVFDAVSAKRCYRDALPLEECYNIIMKGRGEDFDPDIVDAFLMDKSKVEKIYHSENRI